MTNHEEVRREQEGQARRDAPEPGSAEDRALGASFADPNASDDARLGHSFEDTQSSRKKHAPPLKERVHLPANRKPLWIGLAVFALIFCIVLLVGWIPKHRRDREASALAEQQKNAKPVVQVETVQAGQGQAGFVVPGTTIPLAEAYIYARANGYLKRRLVDIGDHVKRDQLLAVIEAPELDQQVDQAREQVRQAEQQLQQQRAQLALATVTVQRYRVLVAKGVFSRQDGDTQEANYGSQLANVAAAQRNVEAYRANLRRTEALQSYEYVRAPFAGVVTQRNVDVGALISAGGSSGGEQTAAAPQGQISASGGSQQAGATNNAGSSGSASSAGTPAQSPGQGGPLFGVAQIQKLRILVSVPEGYVTSIRAGDHAQLAFQEFGGATFQGNVTRTAHSVDPNTRTMLTELQVENRNGKLYPGMYTVASFAAEPGSQGGSLLIDGDAITIRQDRSMVAKVQEGKVHFVPVVIGRDLGGSVEIVSGVKAGDQIVTDITDDVVEGAAVKTQQAKGAAAQPTKPDSENTPPGGDTRYGNQGITDQNLQGKQAQGNQNQPKGKQGVQQERKSQSESKP